jgi:hypothetical protein
MQGAKAKTNRGLTQVLTDLKTDLVLLSDPWLAFDAPRRNSEGQSFLSTLAVNLPSARRAEISSPASTCEALLTTVPDESKTSA